MHFTSLMPFVGGVFLLVPVQAQSSSASGGYPLPGRADQEVRSDAQGHRALAVHGHTATPPTAQLGLDPDWSPIGPFGGDVDDVARSPTAAGVALAGLAPSGGPGGGLYRSTDGGTSWTEVASFAGRSVHDIEFAPDGTAWVGTIDGPWRSVDDGQTWTPRGLGIGLNDQVFEVTLDPADADRVWVGVADSLGNQIQNVLLSTDGGANWTNRTPPGASGQTCRAIAIDPNDSNEVFAAFGPAFGGGSVWFSSNGGSTWTNRTSNLPTNPMRDLHHDGTRVLLCGGLAFGSQFVGLYETTNDGVSWTALHDGSWPSLIINDIEVDGSRIWVASGGTGPYVSDDGGATWSFPAGPEAALTVNEVDVPAGTNEVLLGSSSNAIWHSDDDGASFGPSSFGIGQLNVYSVAVDAGNPDNLAIAFQGLNDGGVYTSTDGGFFWGLESLPGTRFNDVVFDEVGTLYSISDGPTTIAAEGVYRRSGGSWTSIGPDQGTVFETELFVLQFSVNDPDLLVAGGSDFGVAGHEATIWVSPDDGGTWSKVYEGIEPSENVMDIEQIQEAPGQTWVAGFNDFEAVQDGGVLRSADGGQTWSPSGTGLASGPQVESLASDPADPATVYLADNDFGGGGLYRSSDAGQSWSLVNGVDRSLRVETHPGFPATLFTAHFNGTRVRQSGDGGATLGAFDTGLSASGNVAYLALDGTGSRAFLATATGTWARGLDLVSGYCSTSPNSAGAGATIGWSGTTSLSGDLVLECAGLPVNQPGLFYYGPNSADLAFGNGTRCVAGPGIIRLPVVYSNPGGMVSTTVSNGGGFITGPSVGFFQFWYRDPLGAGAFFNLSDALSVISVP